MLIDIHAHTTQKVLWGLHTESAKLVDLEKEARLHDVRKTILLATYFPFKGTGLHNHELLKAVAGNDQFLVFGSLDVMNDLAGGVKELEQLLSQHRLAGIKLYPGYQDFKSMEVITPVLELASKYHVPAMFHTGELHHCCPKALRDSGQGKCGEVCWIDKLQWQASPIWLAQAPRAFPEVKFIFSHLGNPYFDQLRMVISELPNVYTDISGQFLSGTEEDSEEYLKQIQLELEQLLRIPGAEDRVFFGTDFPIQSYESSIAIVEGLNVSDVVKEKIRWKNAASLLRLEEVINASPH